MTNSSGLSLRNDANEFIETFSGASIFNGGIHQKKPQESTKEEEEVIVGLVDPAPVTALKHAGF